MTDEQRRRMSDRPRNRIGRFVVALMGMAMFAGAGWAILWGVQHPPVSSARLYAFVLVALAGAALVAIIAGGSYVIDHVARLVQAIAPIVPGSKIVGRMTQSIRAVRRPRNADDDAP